MAISDGSRPTNTNKFNLLTSDWQTDRDRDLSDSMRETLERSFSMTSLVNNRFQGRTNVAAYELKRNKTQVALKEDWDGTAAQVNAITADQAEFETIQLAWGKLRDFATMKAPQQDIVESQVNPTTLLGDALALKLLKTTDDNIYSRFLNADLSSVTWDYANGTTRRQIFAPEGDASNYLGDDAVRAGTDDLVGPLLQRALVRLSRANQGSSQVSAQQPMTVLIPYEVLVTWMNELGSKRAEGLVYDEINMNYRMAGYELFRFVVSNVVTKVDHVSVATGNTAGNVLQSGGKTCWPIHFLTAQAVTWATRDVMTNTHEPFTGWNRSMDWISDYTAQQLLALDDDRYLWRGWIRAEA